MKYIPILLIILCFSCKTETPIALSKGALNDTFITLKGEPITLKDILKQHSNKTIVIDIWASWCRDCIVSLPKVTALQHEFPEAVYVFLSLDKKQTTWKNAVQKLQIQGEHYYMLSGWDGPFGDFIDLDWIPRYMIVDEKGIIKLFKAIRAHDINLKRILHDQNNNEI